MYTHIVLHYFSDSFPMWAITERWAYFPALYRRSFPVVYFMYSSVCVCVCTCVCRASQVALVVKNPPVRAGDVRDTDLIPALTRSPGGGQCSYLENPMDRGAWQATVHRGTWRAHMYIC